MANHVPRAFLPFLAGLLGGADRVVLQGARLTGDTVALAGPWANTWMLSRRIDLAFHGCVLDDAFLHAPVQGNPIALLLGPELSDHPDHESGLYDESIPVLKPDDDPVDPSRIRSLLADHAIAVRERRRERRRAWRVARLARKAAATSPPAPSPEPTPSRSPSCRPSKRPTH